MRRRKITVYTSQCEMCISWLNVLLNWLPHVMSDVTLHVNITSLTNDFKCVRKPTNKSRLSLARHDQLKALENVLKCSLLRNEIQKIFWEETWPPCALPRIPPPRRLRHLVSHSEFLAAPLWAFNYQWAERQCHVYCGEGLYVNFWIEHLSSVTKGIDNNAKANW